MQRVDGRPLDPFGDVSTAVARLSRRDPALETAIGAIGAPHIRRRPGGFGGLFRIIVEQQVSVPSAQAILSRCAAGLDLNDPHAVLRAGPEGLRTHGLSGPKARYVGGIAQTCLEGGFCFDNLRQLDDAAASAALQSLKGVGPWSAAIYLLFCEGRVDIWPPRDVALKAAYGAAAKQDIDQASLDQLSGEWGPFRGVAAHILWTYYAHIRGRTPI